MNLLVMDVLSLTVDLVDEGKIKVESLHTFPMKHFDLRLVLLVLHVLYHVREPHSQSVVAVTHRKGMSHLSTYVIHVPELKISERFEPVIGIWHTSDRKKFSV